MSIVLYDRKERMLGFRMSLDLTACKKPSLSMIRFYTVLFLSIQLQNLKNAFNTSILSQSYFPIFTNTEEQGYPSLSVPSKVIGLKALETFTEIRGSSQKSVTSPLYV